MRRYLGLCATLLASCFVLPAQAEQLPELEAAIEVRHVDADTWRVEYRFPQAVTAIKLAAVADYRLKA